MIKLIPLNQIEPLRNYREVIPVTEKDPDVIDLAASIKLHGQLQPCLVRLHNSKKDKYQLYVGFRRLMAAKVAGLASLNCEVKQVPDDDVLELQVIENLQRQDPHPMDEAVALQSLAIKRKWDTRELAARFNKSQEYILHRLKLNDLVTELQKDFRQNKMLLGHALLLCRLTPADQAKARKMFADKDFLSKSVKSLEEWISVKIVQDLSKAPWKLDDAELLPAAGACNVCPKRSGAGNLLFKDMAKDNRCMDSACFDQKQSVAFLKNLKTIIETKPDIKIVQYYRGNKIPAEVSTLLKDMNVKILHDGSEFSDGKWANYSIQSKGFYLDGYKAGQVHTIWLRLDKKTGTGKSAKEEKHNSPDIIAGIKERTRRAAELDAEKVHRRIIDAMQNHNCIKDVDAKIKELPEAETVAITYLLFKELKYQERDLVVKKIGIKGASRSGSKAAAELYHSLRELSVGELSFMVRRLMMDHCGTSANSDNGYIFRKMAKQFKDIPVTDFEKEQAQLRKKREARAAERIAELSKAAKTPKQKKTVNGSKNKKAASGGKTVKRKSLKALI
jgi:ParB/RepB/Spo0J family partition protein